MEKIHKRRTILIIAYLFPPIGGGGIQRPLKMAKYLGQFDWDVHVLTVEPTYHVSHDPSLLAQLPHDVTVHRSKEWQLWQFGQKMHAKSAASSSSDQQSSPRKPSLTSSLKRSMISLLKTIKNTINIPDDQMLWYPYASRHAVRIVEEHDIDVIMSTSGPYTNHLVGRYVKKKTGKVWIADFRDPWSQNMHRPGARWRQALERKMEASVVTQCDCLLTVTQSFANNFRKLYGDSVRQIEVIHNGFDPEDYTHLADIIEARQNRRRGRHADGNVDTLNRDDRSNTDSNAQHTSTELLDDQDIALNVDDHTETVAHTNEIDSATYEDKWRLVYTGIFYDQRHPRLLLRAIAELIAEGKIAKDHILLQFAGVFDYPGNNENISCVQHLNLGDIVEIAGHLPHGQALELMAKADVLLLINDAHPDSGDYIPGKLYEYMAIGHPILALSLPGESTNIIESNNLGEVAHPNKIEEIKQALLKLYQQWETGGSVPILSANDDHVAQPPQVIPLIYSRKEQARMLAELMDELVTGFSHD